MNHYKVKLAAPAARAYEQIHVLAAVGKGNRNNTLLLLIDRIINEVISANPTAGSKLCSPFDGIYWISEGTLQFFYEIHARSMTVTLLTILDTPLRRDHAEQVDVICTEMLMSGAFPTSHFKVAMRRAAAN